MLELQTTLESPLKSICLVGPAASGKSTMLRVLLEVHGHPAETLTINPSAHTPDALYGWVGSSDHVNDDSNHSWHDGILSRVLRKFSITDTGSNGEQWVVCDGPVDPVWFEPLSTLLDERDSQTLTLATGERILSNPCTRFIIETDTVQNAAPSFVSRTAIVCIQQAEGVWRAMLDAWLQSRTERESEVLKPLCHSYVYPTLKFVHTLSGGLFSMVEMVTNVSLSLNALLQEAYTAKVPDDTPKPKGWFGGDSAAAVQPAGWTLNEGCIERIVVFAVVWGAAAQLGVEDRAAFSVWWESQSFGMASAFNNESVFDYGLDPVHFRFTQWHALLVSHNAAGAMFTSPDPWSEHLVPTAVQYSQLMTLERLVTSGRPVLLAGPAGKITNIY